MIRTYGSINKDGIHTDTSNTLRGAKRYATINNINNVSLRIGYNVIMVAYKKNKKWLRYE